MLYRPYKCTWQFQCISRLYFMGSDLSSFSSHVVQIPAVCPNIYIIAVPVDCPHLTVTTNGRKQGPRLSFRLQVRSCKSSGGPTSCNLLHNPLSFRERTNVTHGIHTLESTLRLADLVTMVRGPVARPLSILAHQTNHLSRYTSLLLEHALLITPPPPPQDTRPGPNDTYVLHFPPYRETNGTEHRSSLYTLHSTQEVTLDQRISYEKILRITTYNLI